MLKQSFLESNNLFDPNKYFGALEVDGLQQKVEDSRLMSLFQSREKEVLRPIHPGSKENSSLRSSKPGSTQGHKKGFSQVIQTNLAAQLPLSPQAGQSPTFQQCIPVNKCGLFDSTPELASPRL